MRSPGFSSANWISFSMSSGREKALGTKGSPEWQEKFLLLEIILIPGISLDLWPALILLYKEAIEPKVFHTIYSR